MFSCTDLVYSFENVNDCCFNTSYTNITNLCQKNIINICDKFSNGNYYNDENSITFMVAGVSISAAIFTRVFFGCRKKRKEYIVLDSSDNNDVFIN